MVGHVFDAHVLLFQARKRYIQKAIRQSQITIEYPIVIEGLRLKISKGRYYYSWNAPRLMRTNKVTFDKMMEINNKRRISMMNDVLDGLDILSRRYNNSVNATENAPSTPHSE